MNDVAVSAISVMFMPAAYTVNEGMQVTFTAVLSSASESDVTVDFNTEDGTATLSMQDAVLAVMSLNVFVCLFVCLLWQFLS